MIKATSVLTTEVGGYTLTFDQRHPDRIMMQVPNGGMIPRTALPVTPREIEELCAALKSLAVRAEDLRPAPSTVVPRSVR